jgi:hypothetical protein
MASFTGRENLSAIRRFKDDAREVTSGYECGMSFSNQQDFTKGTLLSLRTGRGRGPSIDGGTDLFCGVLVVQLYTQDPPQGPKAGHLVTLERARSRPNVSSADLGPEGSFQDGFLAFPLSRPLLPGGERLDSLLRMILLTEEMGNSFLVGRSRG